MVFFLIKKGRGGVYVVMDNASMKIVLMYSLVRYKLAHVIKAVMINPTVVQMPINDILYKKYKRYI